MPSSAVTCVLDPVTDQRWSRLVARAPNARVFHHPLWLALLHDRYRYPMSAVCVAGTDGELVAGLPIARVQSRLTGTRLVSLPFSDLCGPISTAPDHYERLLAATDSECRRLGLGLVIHDEIPALPGGAASERFVHHVVPLEAGSATVLGELVRPAKLRGAARARRLGVSVTKRADRKALEQFFRLHVDTRHRLGVPTQPWRFFRGLAELFDRELGFVLLAEWNGQPIAAAVYLQHNSVLTYKYGAWKVEHHDKHANDLLHLEALQIACAAGCSALDMGRAEVDDAGLRRYKRELGAEERLFTYTTASPPGSRRGGVRSVSRLQRKVIRRAPQAFGRLLGAAAYRHFA